MSKFIFILLLLFSINLFCQEDLSINNISESEIFCKTEKKKIFKETNIHYFLNNNLCELLSIKPSDLLNEEMLKKLKANV